MKQLNLFLLTMAFTTMIGFAQDIPEKANTIVITQPDSIGLKEKVIKALTGRGHTINSGKTATTITTVSNTMKNGTRVGFAVQIKGVDIILTGKLPIAGQAPQNIVYQGKKGTPIMNGWEEMEKIAKAIGGAVKYETR